MTKPDPDSPPPPTSFLPQAGEEPGVRILKFVVLGLGALLFLGFAALIWRIGTMMNSSQEPRTATPATSIAVPGRPTEQNTDASRNSVPAATSGVVAIPEGAIVTTMSLSGDRLAIHYTTAEGGNIIIFDLAAGQEIQRLRLQAQ